MQVIAQCRPCALIEIVEIDEQGRPVFFSKQKLRLDEGKNKFYCENCKQEITIIKFDKSAP